MKTLFYIGKPYPHKEVLLRLKSSGYKLGLLHDHSLPKKNVEAFNYVFSFDFSTENSFTRDLRAATFLPRIDGILCSYENYIVFKSLAADILSIPAMSLESARASTDKYLMRQKFLSHNPSITPKFALIKTREQLLDFAASTKYPLILKPTNLVKSLLVSKCHNEQELLAAYNYTVTHIDDTYREQGVSNRSPGIIIEEFIEGQMCSVAGFTDAMGNPHLSNGIAELTTAQQAGFNDNFLYARKLTDTIQGDIKQRILEVAAEGIKALGMRSSPAHVEIIYDANQAKLVEIGARIGGYRPFMYQESYGTDLLNQEATVSVGGIPNVNGKFIKPSALYELFPSEENEYVGLSNLKDYKQFAYFHEVAKPGETIGPAKNGHKAAAIIGISSKDPSRFAQQCTDAEAIKVLTK